MSNVYVGKIVGTHGIKGEVKVISDFEYKDKIFKKGFYFYIDNHRYEINSVRPHKNYELVLFEGFDNINQVLFLVGSSIYVSINDLNLSNVEYLLDDLINSKVIDDDGLSLGVIIEVLKAKENNLIRVKGDVEFLMPLIDVYVIKFDKEKSILYTKNAQSLK